MQISTERDCILDYNIKNFMKHFFLALLLVAGMLSSVLAQNYTEIRGTVDTKYLQTDKVILCKVVAGIPDTIASVKVNSSGIFGFLVDQEQEGFYVVCVGADVHRLYLKPHDKANIAIHYESAELVGENTVENKTLYKWEKEISKLKMMVLYFYRGKYTYKDIFPEIERLDAVSQEWTKTLATVNKPYNQIMKHAVIYDLEFYALASLHIPRFGSPKFEEYPSFYKKVVVANKYENDLILKMSYGSTCISNYIRFVNARSGVMNASLDSNVNKIGGKQSRGEVVLEAAYKAKDYVTLKAIEKAFGQYLILAEQRQRFERKRRSLMDYKSGTIAYDFTYPDSTGKMVALSDYKGKVVLVDVWATWCGPCKKEIPGMQELEEVYKGKDIEFISVSVDEAKDKEKWLSFIKERKMGGIQLFGGGWSDITRDYCIKGIPRFMLFDKEGRIISVNAPRPSSKDLRVMIEEALAK